MDYGTRVQKGQLVAVLEIPELQMQLDQDAAAIKNQQDMVQQTQHQIERVEALVKDYQLQFTRLKTVSDSKPGLVAQQEVDDAEGKYMAADAQLEAAKSAHAIRTKRVEPAHRPRSNRTGCCSITPRSTRPSAA